jgi:hypothetical protein
MAMLTCIARILGGAPPLGKCHGVGVQRLSGMTDKHPVTFVTLPPNC